MIIACGNDEQFARLSAVAGHPEWPADERFRTNRARVANRDALASLMAAATRTRTTADWIAAMEAVGVPCGPINTLAEVFADPQVQARGLRLPMAHGSGAEVALVANPVKLSATPPTFRRAPPLLGADTDAVLAELGLDGAEIAALREGGLV